MGHWAIFASIVLLVLLVAAGHYYGYGPATVTDPKNNSPGKPYQGESHSDIQYTAARDLWNWNIDDKWRTGMMPRPVGSPNQLPSMPY